MMTENIGRQPPRFRIQAMLVRHVYAHWSTHRLRVNKLELELDHSREQTSREGTRSEEHPRNQEFLLAGIRDENGSVVKGFVYRCQGQRAVFVLWI